MASDVTQQLQTREKASTVTAAEQLAEQLHSCLDSLTAAGNSSAGRMLLDVLWICDAPPPDINIHVSNR
jgi:hypothetical protein